MYNPFSEKQTTKLNTFLFIWVIFFATLFHFYQDSLKNPGGYDFFSMEKSGGGNFSVLSEDELEKKISAIAKSIEIIKW